MFYPLLNGQHCLVLATFSTGAKIATPDVTAFRSALLCVSSLSLLGGWMLPLLRVDGLLSLPHGVRISGADSWRLCLMKPAARGCWLSARRKKLQLRKCVSALTTGVLCFISQHVNQHLSSDIGIIDCFVLNCCQVRR